MGGQAKPLYFDDQDDLTRQVHDKVMRSLALPEESRQNIEALIGNWVREMPQEMLHNESDPLVRKGWMLSTQVTENGRHMTRLYDGLLASGELSEEKQGNLRQTTNTLVLFRNRPESSTMACSSSMSRTPVKS